MDRQKRPGLPDTSADQDADIALLGGLCLFLSALDYLIPKPLPFMRIGLANFPLLLALTGSRESPDRISPEALLSLKSFCLLALVKALGQALITGTFFSYVLIFSLAGTSLSAALMYLLRRIPQKYISLAGISVAGAFVSNAIQLVLARFFFLGQGTVYLAPPFLAAGIVSGSVLGIFAEQFANQSEWIQGRQKTPPQTRTAKPGSLSKPDHRDILGLCSGLLGMGVFLILPFLAVRLILFALFWLLAVLLKRKIRPLVMLLIMAGITICNQFPPYGKILAVLGPFTIAQGSLLGGIRKALTLEGMIMVSRLIITPRLHLPGMPGRLLGESLRILEALNKKTGRTKKNRNKAAPAEGPAGLIRRLDRLMCELSATPNSPPSPESSPPPY
ncbi:MAG: Gx transporter family protein [Treponema sp.]|nr:Gx transporter family protein [Treponema sp.]